MTRKTEKKPRQLDGKADVRMFSMLCSYAHIFTRKLVNGRVVHDGFTCAMSCPFCCLLLGSSCWYFFVRYVARILLVNQPQVSSFLVYAPFGWLTNQFWIVPADVPRKFLYLSAGAAGVYWILQSPFDVVQPPWFFVYLNLDLWITCW